MRGTGFVIGAAVLVLLAILAVIGYRQFVQQLPCGPNLFADDKNGSFENGNFRPLPFPDTYMPLPDGATDLTGWTIHAGRNPLAWSSNENRFGIKTPSGTHFIDLTGPSDAEPYPSLSQGIALPPGRYQLSFALGQDRNDGFPGPVSAGINTEGVFTHQQTFTTDANRDNWQTFAFDVDVKSGGTLQVSFGATAGQSKPPQVKYVGLDNVSLRQYLPRYSCSAQ
jgi:hypothetical protein